MPGDYICHHGRYVNLCMFCSRGYSNAELPWPKPDPAMVSAFRSTFQDYINTPLENFNLSNQVKELEEKLKATETELEQYKNLMMHERQFHNCQVRPGAIKPYHQLLCSSCHQPGTSASFDPIEEIQKLRVENKTLADIITDILKIVQTTDVISAQDKVEIIRLCTKTRK